MKDWIAQGIPTRREVWEATLRNMPPFSRSRVFLLFPLFPLFRYSREAGRTLGAVPFGTLLINLIFKAQGPGLAHVSD